MHPEIDNPEYTEDKELYMYKDFGAIGFDLWQVLYATLIPNVFNVFNISNSNVFNQHQLCLQGFDDLNFTKHDYLHISASYIAFFSDVWVTSTLFVFTISYLTCI